MILSSRNREPEDSLRRLMTTAIETQFIRWGIFYGTDRNGMEVV